MIVYILKSVYYIKNKVSALIIKYSLIDVISFFLFYKIRYKLHVHTMFKIMIQFVYAYYSVRS